MLQWRMIGSVVIVGIVLVACGGDTDDTPVSTPPTATPPPTPVIADIPTWTPVPSPTIPPTPTLAPTMTSAVSEPTFAPPPETGYGEQGDQVVVTILEADLNAAIAATYDASNLVEPNGPPVVMFEPGGQLEIEVSFTNPFLDEDLTVHVRVILEVIDGEIHLEELQQHRDWTGPTPSNPAIWSVIDLVQLSINDAVFDVLRAQPGVGPLSLIDVRQFPASPQIRARLEAVFAE